jgi:pimeloyl-ACP methyl ester carboxylesterase
MKTVSVFNSRFCSRYVERGKETARAPFPLVFLHGLYENYAFWLDFAARFADEARTLTLDLPGHNAAAPLALGEMFSMREMAEHTLEFMAALGIEKAAFIGHSMGGYLALEIARLRPERVAGVCLFHATPFADAPETRAARLKAMELIRSGGKADVVETLLRRILRRETFAERPREAEALRATLLEMNENGMIAALGAMMEREDASEVARNASFPILALLGDEDPIIPLEPMQELLRAVPRARAAIVPQTAHAGMIESPEACEWEIRAWLEEALLRVY